MNDLHVFNNPAFGEIRTVTVSGEPWFVGKDVSSVLGYEKPTDAVRKHVDAEDRGISKMETPSGQQKMTIINESGLYSLILSSKLPAAKAFKRWVTSDVLPAIRKTGKYEPKPMTDYQLVMTETRRQNAHIQSARLLMQLADQYDGTYKQVLHAHATKELTGDFLLPLPKLEGKTYSAGEVGRMLGVSANMVGILTNRHNLKTDAYGAWFKDKAKGSNKEVPCFRYYESVLPVLRELVAQTA